MWDSIPRSSCWRRMRDRKSTRLNSSHSQISYAVFCLKKKKGALKSCGADHTSASEGRLAANRAVQTPQQSRAFPPPKPSCLAIQPSYVFFFNDTAPTEIYTLSLHDALPISLQQLNGLETLVIIMVANKYAFLQITRRRFLNEWEAFKKVISRRNIRRRITIPLTLSNLKLLRRITRTENILHRNFTRRQVAIQNRVASNIGISQSTLSVKVLNVFRSVEHDQKTGLTTFGQFHQHHSQMPRD